MIDLRTRILDIQEDPFYQPSLEATIDLGGTTTTEKVVKVAKIEVEEGLKYDKNKHYYHVLLLGQTIEDVTQFSKTTTDIVRAGNNINYLIIPNTNRKIVQLLNDSNEIEYRAVIGELFEKEQRSAGNGTKNGGGLATERKDQGRYEKAQLEFLNELNICTPLFMHYSEEKANPSSYRIAHDFLDGIRGDKFFWAVSQYKNSKIAGKTEKIYDSMLELLSSIYYHGTRNIDKLKKKNMMRRIQPLTTDDFFSAFINIYSYLNNIKKGSKEFQSAYSEIFPEFKQIFDPIVKGFNMDLLDEENYYYTPGDMGPHNIIVDLNQDKVYWIDVGHAKEQPWQWDLPKACLSHTQGHLATLENCFEKSYIIKMRMHNTMANRNPNIKPIQNFSELNEKEKQRHFALLKRGILKYLLNITNIGIKHENEYSDSHGKLLSSAEYIYYQNEKYLIKQANMYDNGTLTKFYLSMLRAHNEDIINTVEHPRQFRDFEIPAYPQAHNFLQKYKIY